jgi:hypothetical protein
MFSDRRWQNRQQAFSNKTNQITSDYLAIHNCQITIAYLAKKRAPNCQIYLARISYKSPAIISNIRMPNG